MILFYILFFFFFKQKTAYELRISDWSSDVCSSDLHQHCERSLYRTAAGISHVRPLQGGAGESVGGPRKIARQYRNHGEHDQSGKRADRGAKKQSSPDRGSQWLAGKGHLRH